MHTPILFVLFNRPAETQAVWNRIREARPAELFIAADGPRADRPGEAERCDAARAVTREIDWPCVVHRDEASYNMGCGRREASAFTWAFDYVDRCIILEDDTLPSPSFFPFCETLLDRYADDSRVFQISGFNSHPELGPAGCDYGFSRYGITWGWATWRRAWRHYSFEMTGWPGWRDDGGIEKFFADPIERAFWVRVMEDGWRRQRTDTWDHQWQLVRWMHNGLSVVPRVSLLRNVGFGSDATHTLDPGSPLGQIEAGELSGDLRHPEGVTPDIRYDRHVFDHDYGGRHQRTPNWYTLARWRMILGNLRRRITGKQQA